MIKAKAKNTLAIFDEGAWKSTNRPFAKLLDQRTKLIVDQIDTYEPYVDAKITQELRKQLSGVVFTLSKQPAMKTGAGIRY